MILSVSAWLAQVAGPLSLGRLLIWLIVLAALWAIFVVAVAPNLPPTAAKVVHIVVGAIAAMVAVYVLMSFV
jgi:hypothetical protein